MKGDKPTLPIPVRLDRETISRLARAAKKMGGTKSSVIRLSIINQLPEIERGEIKLCASASVD